MKRGSTNLSGILAIDKPAGITSHDVVDAVRKVTGERRVGHAGTLDPMATGLMFVCVGPATRLNAFLTGHDKEYIARIVFGAATDTDDREGRIVTSYTNKPAGEGLDALKDVSPQDVLEQIKGQQLQLPPAYSAIKKNGVTAYKAAREGKELELEPREISIHAADLLETGFEQVDLDDGNGGRFKAMLPYWDVVFYVSKGTYIRSIARDLGQRLGCGAHLGALRRTAISGFYVEDAIELADLGKSVELPFADPARCLGLPRLELNDIQAKDISCGKSLTIVSGSAPEGSLISCIHDCKLLSVCEVQQERLKPQVVLPIGAEGVVPLRLAWGDPVPKGWRPKPCVVVIGVFDGLHLGHRALITAACRKARELETGLKVLTFRRDPDEFFLPRAEGRPFPERFKLATNAERIGWLRAMVESMEDLDTCVIDMPVDETSLAQTAEDFLEYLNAFLAPSAIFVGEGFRFGAKAAGTTDLLQQWCAERGVELCVQPLFELGGQPVSSTRIRDLLKEGDLDAALQLRAGVAHKIAGRVVHGRGEGTGMGFATANLELKGVACGVMLPAEGVYACWAKIEGIDNIDPSCL